MSHSDSPVEARRFPGLLIAAFLVALFLLPAPCAATQTAVPRKVLAIYDSTDGATQDANLFSVGMGTPINYLGLLFDYVDMANDPLPDDTAMGKYLGVFTLFESSRVPRAEKLLIWLDRQLDQGRKLVVLGFLPAEDRSGVTVRNELVSSIYRKLGLDNQGDFSSDGFNLRYSEKKDGVTGFERALPLFPPTYLHLVPTSAGVEPWITVTVKNKPGSEGVVAAVTPAGAVVLDGYVYWGDPATYRKKWFVNPFDLARGALGVQDMPALTPTTLNGMRLAFSHLDGDGFNGWSEIDKNKNCAEILRAEIFEEFDFPISASVIVAEVNPEDKGNPKLMKLARDIFALPNIEPASHTWTHPFFWDEKRRADKQGDYNLSAYESETMVVDARREIVGSVKFITDHLAPPDRPCRVLLWSGDCAPTEEQLTWADQDGVLAMNGGDTLFDPLHDSLFSVSPLVRTVGAEHQIFTGQANENILTNLWTGPYHGFRNIIETMKRTESPRRLMPIDVYYHFYSAEKFASIQALRDIYTWVMAQQDTAPVFTSAYIRMARDFLKAAVARDDQGRWVFENYGDCLSVRLAPGTSPDLTRSENVLGFAVMGQETYVHLKPGAKRAVVALAKNGPVIAGPYLVSATGWVRDFTAENGSVSLRYTGFSTGRVRIGGLEPAGAYVVRTGDTQERAQADAAGTLLVNGVTTGVVEIGKP